MSTKGADLLSVSAGPAALARIRDAGLRPEDVAAVAGPATGPRWIVFAGIDRALADARWLGRGRDLWLWGASAGAWRFAALASRDPSSAIRLFQETYMTLGFDSPVNPAQVRRELERALGVMIPADPQEREALVRGEHGPRLAVIAVRRRKAVEGMEKLAYASALFLNFFHPSGNEAAFERVVFHSPPRPPPQLARGNFPGRGIPLSARNLHGALLASGSVPFKAAPADAIDGVPGVYQDGGFLDYHVNTCLLPGDDDRLVLLITQPGRIMQRWLDRLAPWRRIPAQLASRLVVVRPSPRLIELLPGRRVPSRKDWEVMKDQRERLAMWRKALEISLPLGDAFMEAVESGSIRRLASPFSDA
jgi:hypothetical protein